MVSQQKSFASDDYAGIHSDILKAIAAANQGVAPAHGADHPKITVTQLVQANAIFAKLPKDCIPALQEKFSFYVWNEETHEVRWMTSFATSEKDVDDFAQTIRNIL